jgi:putative colanic acid biosynthesis UDP-glucose lipid carrier transferase
MLADCIRFSFIISSYHFRNLVRPGITGLAQVNGYHGATPDYESIVIRYYWDAQYIRKAGFLLDLRIMTITFFQELKNVSQLIRVVSRKRKTTLITDMTELNKSSSVSG